MTEAEKLYNSEATERSLASGYLRYALVGSFLVALLSMAGMILAVSSAGKRHAYVVRIDSTGRTEVVAEGMYFQPQPADIKWWIGRFCSLYFSRDRATIRQLPEALVYLEPGVRGEVLAAWKQGRTIQNIIDNQTLPQVDAQTTDVHLSRAGNEAYVQVRLNRVINGQRTEPQMTSTYIKFRCLACDGAPVPDDISQINPLGFLIENVPMLEATK